MGIVFVKIYNIQETEEYGISQLPALVYFERQIPSVYEGDLTDENHVLMWLAEQKESETIEEVNDLILEKLIQQHPYVAVYFSGPCSEGEQCHRWLGELENIDDDTDNYGMVFVTTEHQNLAKSRANVKKFPAVVLFRNTRPLIYPGKIADEDAVLKWLTDEKNLLIDDKIEHVNAKMLHKLIANNDGDVVVFFYNNMDKKSSEILTELERIDDESGRANIEFLKCPDKMAAKKYRVKQPSIVYFKDNEQIQYKGDLMDEDKLLDWLMETRNVAAEDVIEEVDAASLQKLIEERDDVVVFFYEKGCKNCDKILAELENIDDELDQADISFLKTTDLKVAKDLSIHVFPTVIFFEKALPIVYNGDLQLSGDVMRWSVAVKSDQSICEVNRTELQTLIDSTDYLAVLFYGSNAQSSAALKYMEMIDDEADEYGIKCVKLDDKIIAKMHGFRETPGLAYFRRGKITRYSGDLFDEEEIIDWLTDPDNMELSDNIEKVNRKMFERLRQQPGHSFAAVFYSDDVGRCRLCDTVLRRLENIDDDAAAVGIDFVKLDDQQLARQVGVFAVPAVVFFSDNNEPVIYAGDVNSEERLLDWLLSQKDPNSDVIEEMTGPQLLTQINQQHAIAVYFYNTSCADCLAVLNELENIDDETYKHGIKLVKTQDTETATTFGVTELPALIYFENQTPSVFEGDLRAEEDVLQWLILQKSEDRIETVNKRVLEHMIQHSQYLAVLFYKPNCKACETAITELESIDDECDLYGINMVKIHDQTMAKRYGLRTLPCLVYFRNGNPLIFEGDASYSAGVLEWLTDDDNRELAGEIEEVNERMLERLLDESPFVAVFFANDNSDSGCSECHNILNQLENIDDDADAYGIDFVKISDDSVAVKYGIMHTPCLAYFRKRVPIVYEGDLSDDEKVLRWLTSRDVLELRGEIEEVNRQMLDKLLDEKEFVAVYFYEPNCERCEDVLTELETIDTQTDSLDITFVKIRDARYAKKFGIASLPTMAYFRRRFPSIYRGDLYNEQEVLAWLQKNRYRQPELNVFVYSLAAVTVAFVLYTTFLVFCFHGDSRHKSTST